MNKRFRTSKGLHRMWCEKKKERKNDSSSSSISAEVWTSGGLALGTCWACSLHLCCQEDAGDFFMGTRLGGDEPRCGEDHFLTRLSETRTVSLAHVLQALPVPLPPSGPHPATCHLTLASAWSQGARSRRTTGQRHYVCGRLSPGLWPRSCSPDIRPSTTR